MKLKAIFRVICFAAGAALLSCSDDDKELPCAPTEISMVINGEPHTFEISGRGIDLTPAGYIMQLHFAKYTQNPSTQKSIILVMPYKKTGHNVITELIYRQYGNGPVIEGDLVNEDFDSEVIVNRSSCFSATFSGKITDGDEVITITDGKLDYMYDEPFSE